MTSPASAPTRPTRLEVLAMSGADFAAACRRHAWRDPPQIATAESRRAGERGLSPAPAPLHEAGTKYALGLTDAEFDAACKARAWRTGEANR